MKNLGTLYFFSGKMVQEKHESETIKKEKNAVLLSEDEWLENLYPNQLKLLKIIKIFQNKSNP
ncbi:hypothetical protein [Jeotgalicoccus sp. WY2]|uniref:hypothetical protein n=1 Tax=Jeotgalicoccus sp. WY2 TaxID=2708346 RepID=UPI0035305097